MALLLPIIFVFVRIALYDKITDKESIETILDKNCVEKTMLTDILQRHLLLQCNDLKN